MLVITASQSELTLPEPCFVGTLAVAIGCFFENFASLIAQEFIFFPIEFTGNWEVLNIKGIDSWK